MAMVIEKTESMTLGVELGALTECPIWESHTRGKNWCARIHKDPAAPNGLGREFWEKAKGEYFYMVPPDVARGDALEFGSDYYTNSGRRSPSRRYAVVASIEPSSLELDLYATAAQAIAAAAAYLAPAPAPDARALALAEVRRLMAEHGITAEELATEGGDR